MASHGCRNPASAVEVAPVAAVEVAPVAAAAVAAAAVPAAVQTNNNNDDDNSIKHDMRIHTVTNLEPYCCESRCFARMMVSNHEVAAMVTIVLLP